MSRSFSLYLDALRASAALVVVLFHFSYARFSDGRYAILEELELGRDAVIVFFVVSGLVIAFCADKKDRTLGAFAFARITRLFSVALPALLLGYSLDVTGARWYPDFYNSDFYNPVSLTEQLIRGLSFSNEWIWFPTRLGSNGPYWSLSYDAAYYVLIGIAIFLKGWWKTTLLIAACVAVGPNILLLLPCWVMGVWLYARARKGIIQTTLSPPSLIVVPVLLYVIAQLLRLPDMLALLTIQAVSVEGFIALRFSGDFIWNTFFAALVTLHLVGVHQHCAGLNKQSHLLERPIRFFASASFSIYIVHYPLLQFLRPAMPSTQHPVIGDLILLAIVLAACLLFAALFERTIYKQRNVLRRIVKPNSEQVHPPSS